MSSLYSHELIKVLHRCSYARTYSVASKSRKLPTKPSTGYSTFYAAPEASPTSTSVQGEIMPKPRPPPTPPVAPPPSWRFPFSSSSTARKSSTAQAQPRLNQLDESESYYDLAKQASWSDPPLVARARSKTVKERNVWESYLGKSRFSVRA